MQALRVWTLALFLGMNSGWSQTNGNNGSPAPPSAPAQSAAPPTESRPQPQPGQVLPDSTKLEPVLAEKAEYPPEAERAKIQGEVIVKVHVSETGDVDSAEVVSGEPALSNAALEAAKKWKFKPFIRNGKPSRASALLPFDFALPGNDIVNGTSASGKAPGAQPSQDSPAQSSAAPESAGQPEPGGKIVDVPEAIIERMVTHRVQPAYPYELRASGVRGTVVLNVVISKEGRIEKLEAKSGPKPLIPEVVNAVQLWQFKPYNVAGEPVEIRTTITVKFSLGSL
jgi:TonB family protein